MAKESAISWCDSTFNPWTGCTKVSAACDNCYAEKWAKRAGMPGLWGGTLRRKSQTWKQPKKWEKSHAAFFQNTGRRQRVFTASLADFFDLVADPSWRAEAWNLIRDCPHLDWYVVTKRIPNVRKMLPPDWSEERYKHVVLIITVVTQAEVDRDVPRLLDLKRHFPWLRVGLSIEPMLSKIDLKGFAADCCWTCRGEGELGGAYIADDSAETCESCGGTGKDEGNHGLDWVIVGGESGGEARPMLLEWAVGVRNWCADNDVPFHFKQWGEWAPSHYQGFYHHAVSGCADFPSQAAGPKTMELANGNGMVRIGKDRAGRLLHGETHDGFPKAIPDA